MTFNFSSPNRDRINYQLFNSANESIVYYNNIDRQEDNFIETVCVSSTECYRLKSYSYSIATTLEELTLNLTFNDKVLNDSLPGISDTSFGYSSVDKKIKQDSCDNFTICGMDLVDGTPERNVLNMITQFENIADFEDKSSPQYQALCWLLEDLKDPVNSTIIQRYVLAVMFYNNNGEQWINNTHWTSREDHCIWYGISCNNFNGVVSTLNLVANNLINPIPTIVGELTGLEHIDLRSNELVGPFPREFAKLQNLKRLNFSNNKLQGRIPSQIKHLTMLKELILSFNVFTGSLPSEMTNLIDLDTLDLSHNSFSGGISFAAYALINLTYVNVSNNLMRGEVGDLAPLKQLSEYYTKIN